MTTDAAVLAEDFGFLLPCIMLWVSDLLSLYVPRARPSSSYHVMQLELKTHHGKKKNKKTKNKKKIDTPLFFLLFYIFPPEKEIVQLLPGLKPIFFVLFLKADMDAEFFCFFLNKK